MIFCGQSKTGVPHDESRGRSKLFPRLWTVVELFSCRVEDYLRLGFNNYSDH